MNKSFFQNLFFKKPFTNWFLELLTRMFPLSTFLLLIKTLPLLHTC